MSAPEPMSIPGASLTIYREAPTLQGQRQLRAEAEPRQSTDLVGDETQLRHPSARQGNPRTQALRRNR